MKYLIPVITGTAGIIVGIFSALGHNYTGYAFAAALIITAAIAAVITASQERVRPCIVPIRYGREPDGRCGLVLENDNDGKPAYDISIFEKKIAVGSWSLVFWDSPIPRLTKGKEALVESHVDLPSHVGMTGDALHQGMVKHGIVEISVKVRYKDQDNRWYESICRIERDVLASGGLKALFMKQRRIKLFWGWFRR
jgi:hypothetical protein